MLPPAATPLLCQNLGPTWAAMGEVITVADQALLELGSMQGCAMSRHRCL